MSSFLAGPVGAISMSKMSIGRPRVVQALHNVSLLLYVQMQTTQNLVARTLEYLRYLRRGLGQVRTRVIGRLDSLSSQIVEGTRCSLDVG